MRSLNSLSLQTFDQPLISSLLDIASNLEIQSNFCIRHPNYKPLKLAEQVVSRFQQLPSNLQLKLFSSQLCNFLYGIYYNGAIRTALILDTQTIDSRNLQNLENNTFLGVDLEFYERLHLSNNGAGYFDPGWQVLREESDGSLAVNKGNLTLHIQRSHLQDTQNSTSNLIAIKMPPNIVQNGYYMAVGNAGARTLNKTISSSQLVRIYFNLTPEGAVAVMHSLTSQLNTKFLPFTFKALYNPSDYDRFDTAVLYFEKSHYAVIQQLLPFIYAKHQLYFREQVPLFTKMLAPGLALAEEPDSKFLEKESFGLNRCRIVTNALLEAWQQRNESTENRMALIFKHFSLRGIELQRPYLNPNSEDIYATL